MNKEKQASRYSAGTRIAGVFMSAAMLATSFLGLGSVLTAPSVEVKAASADYGLADNIQDGNILHCFCWKYNDIKAMLPEIAEAGFTSIQVSPPQATSGTGSWWWVYQPKGFYIGSTELGNKEELRSLCTEADKYGIKIIADIVANHLAGNHDVIQDDLKDSQYWHSDIGNADDGDRYRVTHGKIGMPDLNTEHSYVQQCVYNYVQELKSVGIDGIRFDAAKHIGLPSEGDQFWPNVVKDSSLWYYGEILNNPGLSFDTQREQAISVMKEYSNYIGITDSPYGMTLRNSFNSGTAPSAFGNYCGEWMGLPNSRLVYWGESHDTWSNNQDWGYSNDMSQNVIDRAYAVAASRNGITALYFSRPSSKVKDDIKLGVKGSTHFTSKEVAAVNHFKNAMNGKADYYTVTNNCSVITRKGGGAVLVKGSGGGQVTVENGGGYATPGTYVDEVSGNTFTVTATTISGTIGDTGIAVIYDGNVSKSAKVSATPDSSNFTTSVTATLNVLNASSGNYTTSDGQSGTYTSGKTITFGSGVSIGGTVTLTLSATGEDGKTDTKTYTYTKTDPNATVKIYFDNSSYNWSSVYAYVYDGSGTTVRSNGAWPGVKMTEKSSKGYYVLDVEDFKNGKAIFTESKDATTNRYPADGESGMSIGGASKKFGANHSWENYSEDTPVPPDPEVPTVTCDKATGSSFNTETTTIKLTLANASSGTYSVDGGPVKSFTSTANVTIGEGKIGDSTITVDTTAKGSDGTTKNYSFTFNKKYVVKTTSSSAGLSKYYKTNPNGFGKQATITIDGDASDWSEDMLIAQGTAWDIANHWKGGHENCVLDTYALFGAWDDTNLYIGWQMVNTTDTWAGEGDGPLSDGGRVLDVPLILALSVDPSSTSMSNKNTDGNPIWGKKMGLTFTSHVDRLLYMSGKPGMGEPSLFKAVDSDGNTNYKEGCVAFADGGIEYKMATTNICSSIIGLNSSDSTSDVSSDDADWVDYKTFQGSKGVHNTKYDSFYEIKIPLATLGITKDYLTSNGIGAMVVATRGESGLDCIPFDTTMLDNVKGDYHAGDNTSLEKEDDDVITVSFARVGKDGDSPVPPSPTTPLQVNFGTDKSAPQYTTTSLTLKAIGMGGTAPYTYEFYVDGSVVKADNSTATYTWKPATKGQHTIKCIIKDSTGKTAVTEKTFTAESNGTDVDELVNNSKVSTTSTTVGSNVTLTGAATGGTSPYKYAFYFRKSGASSWSVKGTEYGTATTATLTPGTATTYEVKISVKDNAGTVKDKTFSINVSGDTTGLTNNSKVSTTSTTVGSNVTLTGAASGGTSPYKYAFYFKKSGDSSWSVKGTEYGTATTATLTPGTATTYTVKISVKDSKGTVKDKTFTINVSGSSSLTNNSKVSTTSTTVGGSVTLTGAASGGTSPYKYAFYYRKSGASSWSVKGTEYGTATTATLNPGTATTYEVKISVKDSKGTVKDKTFSINVSGDSSELTNKSKVSTTSTTAGSTVTLTGAASGGTAPYKYAYYFRKGSETSWTVKGTEYGTATSVTLNPATVTTYYVRIKVKDATGTIKSSDFTIKVNAALTNNSKVSKTSANVGDSITLTGAASGGTSPYKYAFYFKKGSATSWTVKGTEYGTSTTATLNPSTATTYTVKINVKDAKNNVVSKTFTINVAAALTNNSKVSATSVNLGDEVKLTGAASGGKAPYKYAYYFKKGNASSWTVKGTEYGTSTSATLNPGTETTYTVKINVKDANNTVVSKTFTVKATSTLANNSTMNATSVKPGSTVTITGKASGGTSPYKYAFYYKKGSATSWTVKGTEYGSATSVTLNPATETTYTVKVNVKDSAGTVRSKTMTLSVSSSASLANKSTVSTTSVKVNNKVTLKGVATGGTAPYKYAFYFKKSTDVNWSVKGTEFGTANEVYLTPGTAVNYDVMIKVKDASNTVKTKEFSISVTK